MYLKVLNESAAARPPPEASMSDLEREVRRHVWPAVAGHHPRMIETILNIAFDEQAELIELARQYQKDVK
jgi:hypothetical protein